MSVLPILLFVQANWQLPNHGAAADRSYTKLLREDLSGYKLVKSNAYAWVSGDYTQITRFPLDFHLTGVVSYYSPIFSNGDSVGGYWSRNSVADAYGLYFNTSGHVAVTGNIGSKKCGYVIRCVAK